MLAHFGLEIRDITRDKLPPQTPAKKGKREKEKEKKDERANHYEKPINESQENLISGQVASTQKVKKNRHVSLQKGGKGGQEGCEFR